MAAYKLIKTKIEQYLNDNQTYTPIDQRGTTYDNSDNQAYIRPDINVVDAYGFAGGMNKTHISGYLIISVLVPHGSRTTSTIAWDYADKIYNLFNYHVFEDDSLEFKESVLDDIGQVNNNWYQVNITTNQLRRGCS